MAAVVAVACLSACASETAASPPTVTSRPPTTVANDEVVWNIGAAAETMPSQWTLAFTIGYGDDEALLGTAPGGENLTLGPEYGAQSSDGSWWFLDAAKRRLAHYDSVGTYLDQVVLERAFLPNGNFPYQLPRVLADGTLIASRFSAETGELLTLSNGTPRLVSLDRTVLPKTDDGTLVYGFDLDGSMRAIDTATGQTQPVDWFRGQNGERFGINIDGTSLVVQYPDQQTRATISLLSAVDGTPFHGLIEAAIGADGEAHVLLLGAGEGDESLQLGGYGTVSADGTVGPIEAIANPFTPADPGSPGHLGIAYGADRPWFMIVAPEGLHVYARR